jgi:hypothetical protein
MNDTAEFRRPRGRSPSYPAINLEAAIQRARELYEKERQHPTPASTVARHWGYKSLNGPAAVTLAALKKFGLAEDEGSGDARRARVSDLALDILAHPDPIQRQAAIKIAALEPPIHQDLWEKYGSNMPSEASLHWELTRDRGFTETGAKEFIREYKATVIFAKLEDRADLPTQEPVAPAASGVAQESVAAARPERPASGQVTAPDSRRSFPIPLISGGTVAVEGDFPLTEQDWVQFIAVLNAMKPGLVVESGGYDSDIQDENQQK